MLVFSVLKEKLVNSEYWITNINKSVYFKRILPIGVLAGLDIVFTTLAMTTGAISFIEMIKAGIPATVLIFRYVCVCIVCLMCVCYKKIICVLFCVSQKIYAWTVQLEVLMSQSQTQKYLQS